MRLEMEASGVIISIDCMASNVVMSPFLAWQQCNQVRLLVAATKFHLCVIK